VLDEKNLKILVLEDQAITRAGIKALIQIAKPRALIQEASSYEEAIARLAETAFDVAFLDHDLKGEKTGIDVLLHIRERDLDVRAVMLSARDDKALVIACLEAGASGYIMKDMDPNGIFERALDSLFMGVVFLPASALGKGGHSPPQISNPVLDTPESLGISGRRLEALYYLCQGLPNKSIARRMGIAEGTIQKDYNPALFRAFGVARRTELILEVARRGFVIPEPAPSPEIGGKSS
jgi:two-component system nitrate/nitrite response regulator NarL